MDEQNTNRSELAGYAELGLLDILLIHITIKSVLCLWRFWQYISIQVNEKWISDSDKKSYYYVRHRHFYLARYSFTLVVKQTLKDLLFIPILPLTVIAFWRSYKIAKYVIVETENSNMEA